MHSQKGDKRDKSGFPVFSTVIEANCIQKKSGTTNNDLSDDDKRKIKALGNDPQVRMYTTTFFAMNSPFFRFMYSFYICFILICLTDYLFFRFSIYTCNKL